MLCIFNANKVYITVQKELCGFLVEQQRQFAFISHLSSRWAHKVIDSTTLKLKINEKMQL